MADDGKRLGILRIYSTIQIQGLKIILVFSQTAFNFIRMHSYTLIWTTFTLNALEDDGSTRLALDGTVEDVTALPWVIELTGQDDVFIGYDSATDL